jgi:UDP:flavonoid glycosyltransferase YjiC (YdhE family)
MAWDLLLITADAGGNLPPLLAVARELADRGHRVAVAGAVPRDPGIECVPLAGIAGREPGPARSGRAQISGLTRMGMGRALAREARDLVSARNPDVVMVDGIMISTLRLLVHEKPPVAALFHSFGALWNGTFATGAVSTLLRPFGLSPADLWGAAAERLLLTDRELDPLIDAENSVGFTWTGTTEHGEPPEPAAPRGVPRILVSLSSVWQRGHDDVYRRIIAALGELPVEVTVTRSAPESPFEGALPPNVRMLGRTPHSALLRRSSLMIGHGGHSTTLTALAHGVPMLVLPLNSTSDQPLIARTVAENGLGRALPRSASPAEITAATRALLADTSVIEHAAATGERLRAQHGASVAADLIEALAER